MNQKLLLTILAVPFLAACAHERTEIDRELALELVRTNQMAVMSHNQAPIIVQAAPPTVNVTVNANGFQQPSYRAPASEQMVFEQPQQVQAQFSAPIERQNCVDMPVYDSIGGPVHYRKQCVGSR
jgi:hypothetical protein